MADAALETKNEQEDLVALVKKRYKFMTEADHENREAAMDDLKFIKVPGYQWEENMKQERGKRPCFEFNKLNTTIKRIVNDIRANRPAAKVRAVEGGDKETAEINEGLIRNIWNVSDGDSITDYAAEFQVGGGMGAWRVNTRYSDDTGFNQEIVLELVENPFTLYCDPNAKDPQKRDAEDWIYTEKIAYKTFEKRFPGEEKMDFENWEEFDENEDWFDEETVRIAEYWYKEPHEKEIWLLSTGETVDSETDEARGIDENLISRRRTVQTNKIMWCVANGMKILEGPFEWAGSEFPWVVVFGDYVIVDGTPYWWGLTRFAKDAQRSYNISRTAIIENIAQAPMSKWWATPEQADGLVEQWADAHKKNYPFMLYNPDQKSPGPPQRMGGPDIPVALSHETQMSSEDLKSVTGIFDPSLGQQSNETSGRAIYARQQQGEIATFNYKDNIAKGVRRTAELLIDLIPQIYDTERELRILGTDGAEDYVRVNQIVVDPATNRPVRVNDITAGKYDVTVTVGPNFATQRQEAAEIYSDMANTSPELMQIAGDLVFKSMDLPYAEDIADRLKTLLPEPIQQMLNEDMADVDPAVMQAMQQAEVAMQQVQEHGRLVQEAADELSVDKAELEKLAADIKTEQAELRAAKSEFDAHIAKVQAELIKRDAGLDKREAQMTADDVQAMQEQIAGLVDIAKTTGNTEQLDAIVAQFMQQADQVLLNMNERMEEIGTKTDRVPTGGSVSRKNGRLVADVEFSDGSRRQVGAVRDQGNLRIVPVEADSGPESAGGA